MISRFIDLADLTEGDLRLGRAAVARLRDTNVDDRPALAGVFAGITAAFDDELQNRDQTLLRMSEDLDERPGSATPPGIVGAVPPEPPPGDDLVDGTPVARLVAEADRCFMDMARQVSDGRSALFMWRNGELKYRATIDEGTGMVSYDALLPDGDELEGLFTVEFDREVEFHPGPDGDEEDE